METRYGTIRTSYVPYVLVEHSCHVTDCYLVIKKHHHSCARAILVRTVRGTHISMLLPQVNARLLNSSLQVWWVRTTGRLRTTMSTAAFTARDGWDCHAGRQQQRAELVDLKSVLCYYRTARAPFFTSAISDALERTPLNHSTIESVSTATVDRIRTHGEQACSNLGQHADKERNTGGVGRRGNAVRTCRRAAAAQTSISLSMPQSMAAKS